MITLRTWLADLIARYVIADDPWPEHSQLDWMDHQ